MSPLSRSPGRKCAPGTFTLSASPSGKPPQGNYERFPRCESAVTFPAPPLPPPSLLLPLPPQTEVLSGVRDRLRYFGINGIANVEQNGGAEHEYSRRGRVDLPREGKGGRGALEGGGGRASRGS